MCEKTLIKMLYGDAVNVLGEISKNSDKYYQILVKRITVNDCKNF